VPPTTVIPAFDPLKYQKLSLLLIREVLPVDPLYFDGLKEALGNRIIPADSFPAHTLDNQAICLQDLSELMAGILGTPIGVENQFLGNWPFLDSHIPDSYHRFFQQTIGYLSGVAPCKRKLNSLPPKSSNQKMNDYNKIVTIYAKISHLVVFLSLMASTSINSLCWHFAPIQSERKSINYSIIIFKKFNLRIHNTEKIFRLGFRVYAVCA